MKIPDRYQVFDLPVSLTYGDQDRLAPHLANWNKLHEILLLPVTESDLQKMVIIEMMTKKRFRLIDRLLYKLEDAVRARWNASVRKALSS